MTTVPGLPADQVEAAKAYLEQLFEDSGIPTDQPLTVSQQLFLDAFLHGNAYLQITRHADGSYSQKRLDPFTVTLRGTE